MLLDGQFKTVYLEVSSVCDVLAKNNLNISLIYISPTTLKYETGFSNLLLNLVNEEEVRLRFEPAFLNKCDIFQVDFKPDLSGAPLVAQWQGIRLPV